MKRILEGKSYHWNGQAWLDADYLRVPERLAQELSDHFLDEWLQPDQDNWMEKAVNLRRRGADLENRATLRLVARACRNRLAANPDELATIAILSSALRHLGQPNQAEEVTRAYLDAAILTSRAAALCDLGRWHEAEETVKLALRHGGGRHALQVRWRIQARG
jgi:hypothetical protein